MFGKNKEISLEPSTDLYIDVVLEREPNCTKHGKIGGAPCYIIPLDIRVGAQKQYYAGVCGKRIKLSGFDGQISPEATGKTKAAYRKDG